MHSTADAVPRHVESSAVPKFTQTPYTVSVLDLIHRPGEMRERTLKLVEPEGYGNAVIGVREGAELSIHLRLESLHDGILVTGEVDAVVEGECVRCLTEVRKNVEVEFQELFAYSFDEAFDYAVHDDHVNLEPLVRDAVVLALPFQPVCQEDCPGLCPECGVRLLDNPGHEHEAPIDARWGALAGLAEDITKRREGITMAVPKRKMSRASTRMRRAQWKATPPTLVKTIENGKTTYSLPHRAKVVEDSTGNPCTWSTRAARSRTSDPVLTNV